MSLYDMLFGVNHAAPILLATLGFSGPDIPRFRDCFIEGNCIVIHTRTGGGNREFYDSEESCRENYPEYFDGTDDPKGPWNSDLTAHPCYLHDEDDDFDSTYANFYFRFPDEYANELKALAAKTETHTPSEKWRLLLKSLETPQQAQDDGANHD